MPRLNASPAPERVTDRIPLRRSLRPRGPTQLSLSERRRPGATVIGVGGELDVLTAPKLSSRLDEIVRKHSGDLVIDLTDTEFIDSAGLHTLLNTQRRLIRNARKLVVICSPGPVRRLIHLSRLMETLGVVGSLDEYERRPAVT